MANVSLVRTIVPLAGAFAFVFLVAAGQGVAQGQQHDHEQHVAAAAAEPAHAEGMKMECMQGSKMADMAAKKKANTERINGLMAKVNSSSGEAKAAAMADVIAMLLEERAAMDAHCEKK